ncbi:MAG: mycofactocin-coupled SDR family oxidoreductase [Bifidobacteriaceae bacterium]|jgi:SDR family mycofactocin-dependent oxidoreductase|nr:mycofactocin-coupled SDR family oxidoreductase [Bifidobacteriaceae bacterium]
MGRVEGKVAFVTGAARGQGRSHAIRLASEGADIIAVDLTAQIDSVPFALASPEDLQQTVRLVERAGGRVFAQTADVRDFQALAAAVDEGVCQLGRLDIVVANAGILSAGRIEEIEEQTWQDMIDVNLTGVWHAAKAAIPHLRRAQGGSVILTGSTSAFRGFENIGHYVAAKHGVVGLMRTMARELAPDRIRVNVVNPTSVNTDMVHNDMNYALWAPDLPKEERTRDVMVHRFRGASSLPIPWVEAADVSNAVLFLASDEARYVTGSMLTVDGGVTLK